MNFFIMLMISLSICIICNYINFEWRIYIEYRKPLDKIIKNRIMNYREEKMILERKLYLLKHKQYRTVVFKEKNKKQIEKIKNKIIILNIKLYDLERYQKLG